MQFTLGNRFNILSSIVCLTPAPWQRPIVYLSMVISLFVGRDWYEELSHILPCTAWTFFPSKADRIDMSVRSPAWSITEQSEKAICTCFVNHGEMLLIWVSERIPMRVTEATLCYYLIMILFENMYFGVSYLTYLFKI